MVVHFDRLKKCAGDIRLQSKICPSELSTADSDTPPAPNHHAAEGMEIVEDMDDPGPGQHLHGMQPYRLLDIILVCPHVNGPCVCPWDIHVMATSSVNMTPNGGWLW